MEQDTEKSARKFSVGNFIIGLIAIALAGCGIYFLVSLGVNYYKEVQNEKQIFRYEEFYSFIIPAAAIDIEPFEDVTSAKMSELVEMSVWSVLNSGLDPTDYEYSSDSLLLPETQVEEAFIKFFGTELTISHGTVEGYGYEFVYNATGKVYEIPLTTITPIYTPIISEIETKAGTVSLTVGLLNSGLYSQNAATGELTAPEPDKYIKVTFRTSTSGRYISSVRALSVPETATADVTYETSPETDQSSEESKTDENSANSEENSEN
ncbi:MAG: hypothetical protein J1E34_00360 [Oscillospiraceae bacterium]|nr:hypothetical protein [Oscillospiraceae bacterium]